MWNDSQQRRLREQDALHEAGSGTYPHDGAPVVEHCCAVTGCLGVTVVKQDDWKEGRGPLEATEEQERPPSRAADPAPSAPPAYGDSPERTGTPRALPSFPLERQTCLASPALQCRQQKCRFLVSRTLQTARRTGHGPMRSRSTTVRRRRTHVARGNTKGATHTSALLNADAGRLRCSALLP